ncbi:EexN family lipoprotein [uncultured Psychrosphaera sp.]|jgi:uncharacterized protein YcfL|uniref:EexN family lipoprotein n=1 Tax=uncultured Psychrosphaera sp. TaxID=1403522 RepID=UPI00260EFB28|nr:EexN family lipoprotein [uncultured Psychrosphaera sp.]
MKKLLLIAPFALLLTACGTPSVEDLVEDQELLTEVSLECTKLMMEGKDTNTEECKNAALAQKKVVENMTKGLMDQLGN